MNKYRIINHSTKEESIVEAHSAQDAALKVGCRLKDVSLFDIGQPKLSGMPLSKAIEILTIFANPGVTQLATDDYDAILLGIEALKECKKAREGDPALDGELLPGETEGG